MSKTKKPAQPRPRAGSGKAPAARGPSRPRTRTQRRSAAPAASKPSAAAPLDKGLTVVGVGASAGGLEAFSQLLRAVTATTDLAIVFVQHLSPDHDSALVSLLSAQTSLRVVQAVEGMRVRAGYVYVIPP